MLRGCQIVYYLWSRCEHIEYMEALKDVQEWVCTTKSKRCAGSDPCYFNRVTTRCPAYGFVITYKEVLGP